MAQEKTDIDEVKTTITDKDKQASMLVAMSGGVDSSLALMLMKEQGYRCIGATMRLHDKGEQVTVGENSCCSLSDIEMARQVASQAGVDYHVVDFQGDFRHKVMDKFVASYMAGETPNPCIDCNRHLKFKALYEQGELFGCQGIVTGHYARVTYEDGEYCLKKAVDYSKDQSYVLYSIPREQLAHTHFPLGEYTKDQVREMARERGLINADKKDSQDICFIPDGDYKGFMARNYQVEINEGNFVDEQGNILGKHKGYYGYTVGQRKGLGISSDRPYHVLDMRPATNEVVLGRQEDLYKKRLLARECNWLITSSIEGELVQAKVRYRQEPQDAYVHILPDGYMEVEFIEPQRSITRGQAVVIYRGDRVLGGGTIHRVLG